MKKLLLLAAILLSPLAGAQTTSVTVHASSTSIYAGQTSTLSCTQNPSGSPCTTPSYSVTGSNTVWSIAGSTATGVAFGTATLTATANGFTSAGVTVNDIPPPTENLGNIPSSTILNGFGLNVTPTNSWEFTAAKTYGAKWVRFQCGWEEVEIQSAPPNNTSSGYTMASTCPNALSYAASNGLNVDIVAAFGPPYHQILTVTVPGGASSGATSINVTFSSGVGGDTLSNLTPFLDNITNTSGGSITTVTAYPGSLITAVSGSGTTRTLTLASGLSSSLPANGTLYYINENLYRPPATWSSSNASVQAYGNYAAYLAGQIHAAGLTGRVELWNEPPWGGDPWDNICDYYSTNPCPYSPGPQGQGLPDYGFAAYLQTLTAPSGATYNWGGTEKSGSNTLANGTTGSQMFANTGVNLTLPPVAIPAESLHPYASNTGANNPEQDAWELPIMLTTTGSNDFWKANFFGVGGNFSYAYQQSMLANNAHAGYGLTDNATETQFGNIGSSDMTHFARWDLREFLVAMAEGLTDNDFYRLYENPNSDGLSLTDTSENPYQPLTDLSDFEADMTAIKYPPPQTYNSSTLTSITSWGNLTGYPLTNMHIVGATTSSATANSEIFVLWQRTYTTSTNWYSIASPTAEPVTVTMPAGQTIISATNLNTRASVSYSVTGQAVTFNVADDPVELLIEPGSSPTLPNPILSPTPGTYYPNVTVSITDSGGGTPVICYTTDGSTPTATTAGTCSHGTTYSSSFVISTTSTVNAIATESGYTNSGVASGTYTITPNTTINWTSTNQTIQGFGGSNAFASASMSSANQTFFFGTGSGDLGMSILRVEIPDANSGNPGEAGSCATVNSACAGTTISDMTAVTSNGGIVIGSPWSPPASMKSNGAVTCTSNAYLLSSSYSAFATWLTNWVSSMQTYASITPYAVSIQNEGDSCSSSYSTATYTAAQYDAFLDVLIPAWSTAGYSSSVKLMFPEMGIWSQTNGWAATCAGDASCYPHIGVINWHDYDATVSGTNTVNSTPFSSVGWPNNNPQYWETEASCPGATIPCGSGESPGITDALNWGAVVDDRLVNENANAWMYWWLQSPTTDAQGLMDSTGAINTRAYMLGQYSRFVRPGSVRITATHNPVSTVTVSAYRPPTANTIAIVATNYASSSQAVVFNLSNAPTFSTVTPVITSSTQNMVTLSSVGVTSQSFTYTLPAQSIITFTGTGSGGGSSGPPTSIAGTQVTNGSVIIR